MGKSRFIIPAGQILTVIPVGDVQVYSDDGAAGGFLSAPTTYGPFNAIRDLIVDGSFTAALTNTAPADYRGTFVAIGASAVTVANANVLATDAIVISLNTVGGTVGAIPKLDTISPGVGFTVKGTAGDTSTYNYAIVRNAV